MGTAAAERLAELRGVLAALADEPIATLEAHPLPDKLDRGRGIPPDAASPLAQHLSQLITQSARGSATAAGGGEALYRMVIPAKVAAQVGQGTVRSMAAKGVAGGVRGPFVDSAGKIVAGATYVPVGTVAPAGAAGGAGATGGVAVAGSAALTVAAPLVLMAVAVGMSAHADQKRRQAIERITELLEQLHEDRLVDERRELDGCRFAIGKATAILLDEGKLGVSPRCPWWRSRGRTHRSALAWTGSTCPVQGPTDPAPGWIPQPVTAWRTMWRAPLGHLLVGWRAPSQWSVRATTTASGARSRMR